MKSTLSKKIANVLWIYIQTQCMLITVVTLVSWGVLSRLGIAYPLILGILSGSASIVPILGLTTAAIIAALVATFDNTRFLPNSPAIFEGILVLILYGLLNIGVDYFLSPYLVSKTTKIHPIFLLSALIVGTLSFGIIGSLFAIPALLVIKTIMDDQQKH